MIEKINRGWKYIKEHRLLYNLLLVCLTILAVSLTAFFIMSFGTRHGMRVEVPDLSCLKLKDAEMVARKHGMKVIVNDSLYVPAYPGGTVLEQLPLYGATVKKGRKIYVTINSFHQRKVPVPYVAGRSLRQAKNMLENAGLQISRITYVPDIATNYVLSQFVGDTEITSESRVEIEKGSGIALTVGVENGYGFTSVPRLVGKTLRQAKSRLWESGLNIGSVRFDPDVTLLTQEDAKVFRQSVNQGSSVPLGGNVSIYLTLDEAKISKGEKEHDSAVRRIMECDTIPSAPKELN